jgi:type II secretory pathway component PulM
VTWWKFWDRPCPRRRERSEQEAERRLAEVRQQKPIVERLAAEMESQRDQFTDAFIAAMRGNRR